MPHLINDIVQLSPELRTGLCTIQQVYALLGASMKILDTFQAHPQDSELAVSGDIAQVNIPPVEPEKIIDFITIVLGHDYRLQRQAQILQVSYEPKAPLRR